ncbi:MAG TPA: tetratricopeptide repeat protein [Gemmataceae bacterium]|nr:tetratricopeptide repeat protein [Gemmataceae bacterium]
MIPSRASRFALALLLAGLLPALARCESAADYRQQALAALMKKETTKALALAGKAIAADPKDARGYLVRGTIHEASHKHTEAVADFSKCLELDPRIAIAYNRRGAEQFKLGHVKESLADFDRFLELEPKAAPSHWMRGISLYYVGRFDDGRKQFKAGDQVFANDVENAVWHFLCNVHVVGIDKARAAILKIGKDTRVPMMEVYDLYRGKAKPADVLTAAEAGEVPAELRKEQLFYAHLYLGLYYDATGDKQKALKHMALAEGKYRIGHYMGDVAHVHAELLRKELKK